LCFNDFKGDGFYKSFHSPPSGLLGKREIRTFCRRRKIGGHMR
jgi:hypothetical protein